MKHQIKVKLILLVDNEQALRFYESYNVTIVGINIINSPLCHLKFDNSKGVKVKNVTISAPENSPNTDGIHLQNTQDVEILQSDIGTGKQFPQMHI